MIRILQVTEALKQRYGVTSVIMTYYRAIDRKRIQFDFLVNEAEPHFVKEIEELGGRVFFFPELHLTNLLNVRKSIRNFYKIHGREFVAVHSAFTQLEFLTLGEAARFGIQHRISHSHATSYTVGGWLKTIRNKMMHCIGRRFVTDFFACGDEAGLFMFGEDRMNSHRYYKMRNAIRIDLFTMNKKKREMLRLSHGWKDDYVIACVGSLTTRKNQSFLVSMMPELIRRITNVRLILIGEGPARSELETMIENLGLQDNCCLLGISDRVPDYLSAIDCYALPSLMEGLPISVIEAQVAGLPCLLSDCITREVDITGLCYYISLENPEKWISTIIKSMGIDRIPRNDTVTNAGYNINIEAQRLAEKYESMC